MPTSKSTRALKVTGGAAAVLLAGVLIMPALSAQYGAGATATGHLATDDSFSVNLDHQPVDSYDLAMSPRLDPGQSSSKTITVYNDSSLSAYVWLDSVAMAGGAEFAAALQGSLTSTDPLASGPLATLTTRDAYLTMPAHTATPLSLVVSLPLETGNEVLNQSATATFNFVAQTDAPIPTAPPADTGTLGNLSETIPVALLASAVPIPVRPLSDLSYGAYGQADPSPYTVIMDGSQLALPGYVDKTVVGESPWGAFTPTGPGTWVVNVTVEKRDGATLLWTEPFTLTYTVSP